MPALRLGELHPREQAPRLDGINLRVLEIEGSRIQRLEVEFGAALPEPGETEE